MANHLEPLRKVYGQTWDMWRQDNTYVAVRRRKLRPDEYYCGLTDEIRKNAFGEFAAELGVQGSLYRSLIDSVRRG